MLVLGFRVASRVVPRLLVGALAVICPASPVLAQPASTPTEADEDPGPSDVPEGDTPERARARALATEGMELVKKGETERGIAKLEEALALVPVPTIAMATADAMLKVGRYVDALATYRKAAEMEIPDWITALARMKQQLAKDNASRKIPPLLERVPKVRVTVIGLAPERVTIDGEPQDLASLSEELFVDPGVHVFEASAGASRTSQNASVQVGGAITVTLKLDEASEAVAEPLSPPAPAPDPVPAPPDEASSDDGTLMTVLGWVAVGLGGASLGAMTGTWVVASGLASDLEAGCNDGVCNPTTLGPDGVADLDRYDTLRTTTIILGVAGGVLAATGVTLLLTAPSGDDGTPESAPEVALDLGPMHAGVHGRF